MAKNNSNHKKIPNKNSKTTKSENFISKFPNKYKLIYFFLLLAAGLTVFFILNSEDLGLQLEKPPKNSIYKQSSQPIEKRVEDLLSRMTLEEKIGQMSLVDKNSLVKIEDISRYNLGAILSGAGAKPDVNNPDEWFKMIDGMKRETVNSRLEIPILYGIDANHGHSNVLGATIFPHAIGLGASGDNELVKQVAEATSKELRATGVNWDFSPSLDAPKDIRWGRVYEAFSDSPELNGSLGRSYIEGVQSVVNDGYILATAKHYLATGSMEWGESNHKTFKIDQGKTSVNETALANEYLIPYKEAVAADVSSVMVSLNQWGDERVIDSEYLITEKLKNELGFKGIVVSDWYGVYEYSKTSKYQANINSINAGLDMAMLPYDYKDFLKDVRKAVKNGRIKESRIDDAVGRILYQKFKSGLFDTDPSVPDLKSVGSVVNHTLARKAVASSAVLLKNNSVIPISVDTKNILVAGSGADNVGRQSGAWTIEWQGVDGNWIPGSTSILQGIRQSVTQSSNVKYSLDGQFPNQSKKADIGIAIVSEKPYAEGWGDKSNPTIDNDDLKAIENLKISANKVIVVIVSGRPLLITEQINSWDAAVEAWLPGSEGGGIADVLFGKVPFVGKLPLPWPAKIEQLPIKTNGVTSDGSSVLFKRGWGL